MLTAISRKLFPRAKAHKKQDLISVTILITVLLILILGYLIQLPYKNATIDSAEILVTIQAALSKNQLPAYGIINSQGVYNPPHFVWLFVLPALFSEDIFVLGIPPLLLHITALLLLYALARRYFDTFIATIALILYGFFPIGLYFGTSSWAQGIFRI